MYNENLMFTDVVRIFKDGQDGFYPKYCSLNFLRYDQEMNPLIINKEPHFIDIS